MASFGSKLVRESVFVAELEQEFTSRLGLSCSESSLSPSVTSNLGSWLSGLGLQDYEQLFIDSGYDDVDFIVSIFFNHQSTERSQFRIHCLWVYGYFIQTMENIKCTTFCIIHGFSCYFFLTDDVSEVSKSEVIFPAVTTEWVFCFHNVID